MNKKIIFTTLVFLAVIIFGFGMQFAFTMTANAQFVRCHANSDCGQDGFYHDFLPAFSTCRGSDIYRKYASYKCVNPGTNSSTCVSSIEDRFVHSCSPNQCQSGKCVSAPTQGALPQPPPMPPYVQNATKVCVNNISYWYDSLGNRKDVFQNCNLTGQTCSNGHCVGQVVSVSLTATQPSNILQNNQIGSGELAISFFLKKDNDPLQWGKEINVENGDTVNFLAIVKNNSNSNINDALLRVNLTSAIAYAGNLKINEVIHEGDIINGINLGFIAPASSKAISFNGTVQSQSTGNMFNITANVNRSTVIEDTDQVTLKIASAISTAALSETGIVAFVKQWYLWIIIAVIVIFLLFILFRRLSLRG